MNDFIDLQSASGVAYRFRIWRDGAAHLPIAGNFACIKEEAQGFTVLCVGECNDLSQLRSDLPKAVLRVTTHVFTRLNVGRAVRLAEHADLTGPYKPVRVRESATEA